MDGEAAVADIVEQPVDAGADTGYEEPVEHEDVSEQPITEPEPRVEEQSAEVEEPGAKEVGDALKALKKLNPEYARVIDRMRKDFFETGQFRESFPSARDAKIAKLAWDSVGGEEGFAQLREHEQWMQWVDQAAEAGDSSIIDDWAKDFPEGFREVMPYAVKKWAQMDGEAFSKAIGPHLSGFLDRAGLADRLSEAFDAIESQNPRHAQSVLRNIFQWVQAHRKYSGQGGAESVNPADEKLTQRENAVREQEERAFRGEIGRETFQYQQSAVQKALAPYLRGAKISEQARGRLVSNINADINENLDRNEGFQRQMKAYLSQRDSRGTVAYLKGQLDLIIPSISKRVWQDMYGPLPKAAKAGTFAGVNGDRGRVAAPAGEIRLNRKPALSEIEKDRDYMAAYIAGRAIMARGPYKGKLVRWK